MYYNICTLKLFTTINNIVYWRGVKKYWRNYCQKEILIRNIQVAKITKSLCWLESQVYANCM